MQNSIRREKTISLGTDIQTSITADSFKLQLLHQVGAVFYAVKQNASNRLAVLDAFFSMVYDSSKS